MTTQSLTLKVPDPLYDRLQQRAAHTRRSVEDETLEILIGAVSLEGPLLTEELSNNLDKLAGLDDAALWQAARSRLTVEMTTQLGALHLKRQREGLTDAEVQNLAGLIGHYEQAMLVRARAAALLKQRGHDIGQLLTSQ